MSQCLNGSALDNSINLDEPSRFYLGKLGECFFENRAWDSVAEDLARPHVEAFPPLKNRRNVFRQL